MLFIKIIKEIQNEKVIYVINTHFFNVKCKYITKSSN
jgi:hypothetical protein